MGVRIGCATAWSGDRFGPAEVLVERGDLDYLFFEAMSETTMSGAQIKRAHDPTAVGYDPYLELRLRPILAACCERSITIISNQGWLDPAGAARRVAKLARTDGLDVTIAAIVPAPLEPRLATAGLLCQETGEPVADYLDDIVSAEAYLGAWEIVEALEAGADIVFTSRVTDASLVLGPLIHELGWKRDDWDKLARGVIIGHLLECSAHVTGGNFADPGYCDVPGLDDLGHPIGDIDDDLAFITKPDDTGGLVSVSTCKAQLLYEVGDPANYLNPDVIADFTTVSFEEIGPDRIAVHGGRGAPPPETLKALIGLREGFFSEEVMLYAGPGAIERARLAESILRSRLDQLNLQADDLRFDYIGINAIHREATPPDRASDPYEVALRVAARAKDRDEIEKLSTAVAPMAVSGPVATGKWGTLGDRVRPIIGMNSALVPRDLVPAEVHYFA
jgi:hypothetical protein